MNKDNKKFKTNREKSNTITQGPGGWLMRIGMWDLAVEMALLSMEYKLGWSGSWAEHLDDPAWLRRAIYNTWDQLTDQDKERLREDFENWKWIEQHLDLEYLAAEPEFWALCYILDGDRQRVIGDGRFVTICRVLSGQTKEEAIAKLDGESFEFIRWL